MNPHQLSPGHSLCNRYSIRKVLGQGGFGITYLAFDNKLEQEVCIKELFVSGNSTRGVNMTVQSQGDSAFSFTEFADRFVQEAKQLARFQHPNIVRVIDIFQENETAYTVMEFVNGETLKERVSRIGALDEKEAMLLVNQLLDAVEMVHTKGMLHRDIKPENILISPEGRVVLIDFGSAREFAEGKTTHQTAMITPGYAPPEQYSERAKRGPFTDIYALGATIYFLLTGEKPISSSDRSFEELLAPQQLNPRLSSQVSNAILQAMELKPENRFQSISEMKGALTSSISPTPKIISSSKKSPSTVVDPKGSNSSTVLQEKPIDSKGSSSTVLQEKPINPTVIQESTREFKSPTPKTTPPAKKNHTWVLVLLFVGFFLFIGLTIAVALIIAANENSSDYPSSTTPDFSQEDYESSPSELGWSCGDGTSINAAWLNDGDCDCDNCADEDGLFKCANGTIIDIDYLNDGDCDCGDICDDES